MNDELFKVLITVLGTVMTLGIGYLITKVTKVENTQVTQAVSFARLEGVVMGLQGSIDRIHNWRNQVQEREFKDMQQQVIDYKNALKEARE